jgi:hypothetical protein
VWPHILASALASATVGSSGSTPNCRTEQNNPHKFMKIMNVVHNSEIWVKIVL